jgi:predicted TIM-barrel enzyme
MPFIDYRECVRRLHAEVEKGRPIIGAGAGTGISAKFAESGGVDLIIVYNSGRYRMAGRGSAAGLMPYGDANAIVTEMAGEVLPIVKHTPVLAGVCGTDPFRFMHVFLKELKQMGFDGVQNFPTVGVIDGNFRQILEETGMSYDLEVELIRRAHELEMLTCPYVFDEEQAVKMTEAGADIIVTHMNTTVKGSIGVSPNTAPSLEEAVGRIQAMRDAAKAVNPDVLVLCHGGPIAEPEDAQYIFEHTEGIAGFFGASSIERLATESAIEGRARQFKELKMRVPVGT